MVAGLLAHWHTGRYLLTLRHTFTPSQPVRLARLLAQLARRLARLATGSIDNRWHHLARTYAAMTACGAIAASSVC